MELVDRDLLGVQEVRNLIRAAKEGQKQLAAMSQQEIDAICAAMAKAGYQHAHHLAKMAQEETGFGIVDDKTIKNEFASMGVYNAIKDLKTVGILDEQPEDRIYEVGVPMGIVAGIVPSTNPTSTIIYKALISIKSGNAIIFSPHPSARNCNLETTRLMEAAAVAAGCPKGVISCIEYPSLPATHELMSHEDIAVILATGGGAMVKAAYSSGNPAIGVGPGNGPAYIERSADIPLAVKHILDSKAFDNGTICASEQSIITEEAICDEVIAELQKQGAYFLSPDEKEKVASILMRANGTMNPAIVGKSPQYIASLAGLSVPDNIRVLIGQETEVGHTAPFSREKLCPVLAFYVEKDWENACDLSIRILMNEGAGHTMMIHSTDEDVIREFAFKKPVSRLLVNTPGSLGGVGATTHLFPAFTLGCGAVGGSSSSDNIGPMNLLDIRRIAYGTKEIEEIRAEQGKADIDGCAPINTSDEDQLVDLIVKQLLEKLANR